MATSGEKRLPRLPFNLRTTPLPVGGDASPPRTPVNQSSRPGAASLSRTMKPPFVRPSARETFLDDTTPVDNVKAADGDLHDLSMPARETTRVSLVDNLVISLDRHEPGQLPPDRRPLPTRVHTADEAIVQARARQDVRPDLNSRFSLLRLGRSRGHSYSASYSSDYELREEDPAGSLSMQQGRSRNRNARSSSQTGLERIDSLRGTPNENGTTFEGQRALPPSTRSSAHYWHGRGRRSKSSGSSSFDAGYVQIYGSTRWATSIGQPSSGQDHELEARTLRRSPSEALSSGFSVHGRSEAVLDGGYDAAPTPVIPAGPSRQSSPVRQGVLQSPTGHLASPGPLSGRRRSIRSSRGLYVRRGRSESIDGSDLKHWPAAAPVAVDRDDLPPPGSFIEPSAPSPTVSYHKTFPPVVPTTQAPRPKERPGFFRRVFGSSRTGIFANKGTATRQASAPGLLMSMPDKQLHLPAQASDAYADKALPVEPLAPPPLAKKTSSFFRRRKKSISESRPVPPAGLSIQTTKDGGSVAGRPFSPVSSLREVMNPYIRAHPVDPEPKYDAERRNGGGRPARPQQRQREMSRSSRGAAHLDGSDHHDRGEVGQQSVGGRFGELGSGDEYQNGRLEADRRLAQTDPVATELRGPATVPHASAIDFDGRLHPSTQPRRPSLAPGRSASDADVQRADALNNFYHDRSSPSGNLSETTPDRRPHAHGLQDWIATPPAKIVADQALMEDSSAKSSRIWLEPRSSEDSPEHGSHDAAPAEDYHDAVQALAEIGSDARQEAIACDTSVEAHASKGALELTDGDRSRARELFETEEASHPTQSIAARLGEPGDGSARLRKAYLEHFDWTNQSILAAMRELCSRLVLRAETQQVDRILDAASTRWCQCNPRHGFKAPDVVHTICYSIILLNTDLHMADIEQKMTRNQFIKNTLPTIRRVAEDAAPDAFEPSRASSLPLNHSSGEPGTPTLRSLFDASGSEVKESRPSLDGETPTRRLSFRPTLGDDLRVPSPTHLFSDHPTDDCGPLVRAPFNGTRRAWEVQVEIVLKNFYNSIRQQRLPLRGVTGEHPLDSPANSNTLSILTSSVLKRTPSTLSKAHSENLNVRGRSELQRLGSTGRWASKNRCRPRPGPAHTMGSSRTSFDDQSSIWTPSGSSTWSRYSLSKTQTSMSVGSHGSHMPKGEYQQAIGFANALSQAIIREEAAGGPMTDDGIVPLLDDETLGLAGAPWAKEGIVQHKHHLDTVDRKAKDRNWSECFAVIEKGWMRLFSFSGKHSIRQRNKGRQANGVVGGGNWTENAEAIGALLLRQTIASALPSPGYSKTRPYVWALSLPTGAVHLFQAGTPEIVKEFVSTANYWSARFSKEPLVGGICNIEYGWSDTVINQSLLGIENIRPPSSTGARPSLQGSMRSSIDHAGFMKPRLPGDRAVISDWHPPQQSMVASQLGEADQLKALIAYVKNVEKELELHNELRGPMLLAFSSRHPNSSKAMGNWEKKSSYLLREIVKFRTYIDCLTAAQEQQKQRRDPAVVEVTNTDGETETVVDNEHE